MTIPIQKNEFEIFQTLRDKILTNIVYSQVVDSMYIVITVTAENRILTKQTF